MQRKPIQSLLCMGFFCVKIIALKRVACCHVDRKRCAVASKLSLQIGKCVERLGSGKKIVLFWTKTAKK